MQIIQTMKKENLIWVTLDSGHQILIQTHSVLHCFATANAVGPASLVMQGRF